MSRKKSNVIPFSDANGRQYDAEREKEENIIGRKIAEARKKKGMSIAVFSEYLKHFGVQISAGGAGKWEIGYCVPNAYQMVAICLALGIEDQIPYFMKSYTPALNPEGEHKVQEYRADLIASGRYRPVLREAPVIRFIDMPVSELPVSAGTGTFLEEGSFEQISFPEDKVAEGADFGLRVSGDSMEPVYHDGQIIWVQQCEQVPVGQVGVFLYDGQGYVKIYSEQEPEEDVVSEFTDSYGNVHPQPVLLSYNRQYGPRAVRPGLGFRVVGWVL